MMKDEFLGHLRPEVSTCRSVRKDDLGGFQACARPANEPLKQSVVRGSKVNKEATRSINSHGVSLDRRVVHEDLLHAIKAGDTYATKGSTIPDGWTAEPVNSEPRFVPRVCLQSAICRRAIA